MRLTYFRNSAFAVLACLLSLSTLSCGQAKPLQYGGVLGDAVVGTGGSRTDGAASGLIYTVTSLYQGTGNATIPGYTHPADFPFTGVANAFGINITDRSCPFYFTYTYPSNNYKLSDAHLIIDTLRDSSDTEAIFVDGVFTGRPPFSNVNTSSTKITHHYYNGNTFANPVNAYFMDYALQHYTIGIRQTFDIALPSILPTGTKTIRDVISDGFLPVVTGDDSPVYQAFLVNTGYTISRDPLSCSNTSTFTFTNQYVHNDGNSIGSQAFTGTVESPFQSTTSVVAGFKSIEFYYDIALPRVDASNITIANATISVTLARNTTATAIVVNGVGVSDASFDRTTASSVVEKWHDLGTTYWNTVLAGIPTTSTPTAVTIDLASLLGASQLKTLLAQGKLNIAFGGGFRRANASNNSSGRTYGVAVSGPTFSMNGTYFNTVCIPPNDPTSPIQDTNPPPSSSNIAPQIYSVTLSEIKSNSVLVQWLTDQATDSQVFYGVGNTSSSTALDTTPNTFHSVLVSGLTPYKYYFLQVRSANQGGGVTTSPIRVFRTLR